MIKRAGCPEPRALAVIIQSVYCLVNKILEVFGITLYETHQTECQSIRLSLGLCTREALTLQGMICLHRASSKIYTVADSSCGFGSLHFQKSHCLSEERNWFVFFNHHADACEEMSTTMKNWQDGHRAKKLWKCYQADSINEELFVKVGDENVKEIGKQPLATILSTNKNTTTCPEIKGERRCQKRKTVIDIRKVVLGTTKTVQMPWKVRAWWSSVKPLDLWNERANRAVCRADRSRCNKCNISGTNRDIPEW